MLPRKDLLQLILLLAIAFAIYYPVFYSDYLYTDEAVQLWLYKKDSGFHMFNGQGRHLTDWLFHRLFDNVNTISGLKSIRLFSFFGWLFSVVIWYSVLRKVTIRESLPAWLPFILSILLIASPTFTISIGWASCCELFIAYTAGLLSGYALYLGIRYEEGRVVLPFKFIIASVLFGLISLFTYQNGIGCFLIPFLMNFLARPGQWRKLIIGLGGYLVVAVIYFALFRYQIRNSGLDQLDRTELHLSPLNKLVFFFTKSLSSSFHLNYLVNENNRQGVFISMALFAISLILYYVKMSGSVSVRIKQILLLILILIMSYLPSLLVKENYASNRTLLALSMVVWLFLVVLLSKWIWSFRMQTLVLIIISTLFIVNAFYNYHFQFLKPQLKEYKAMRLAIEDSYQPGVDSFHIIRPSEELHTHKYGVTRSWDEFGVPSLYFEWVPPFFVKQVVYEKVKDRKRAESLAIGSSLTESKTIDNPIESSTTVTINAPAIIAKIE